MRLIKCDRCEAEIEVVAEIDYHIRQILKKFDKHISDLCINCDGELSTFLLGGINLWEGASRYPDSLDGLKFALEIIEQVENNYRAIGHYPFDTYERDPINDIVNAIRMRLGIKLIPRPIWTSK